MVRLLHGNNDPMGREKFCMGCKEWVGLWEWSEHKDHWGLTDEELEQYE